MMLVCKHKSCCSRTTKKYSMKHMKFCYLKTTRRYNSNHDSKHTNTKNLIVLHDMIKKIFFFLIISDLKRDTVTKLNSLTAWDLDRILSLYLDHDQNWLHNHVENPHSLKLYSEYSFNLSENVYNFWLKFLILFSLSHAMSCIL